MSGSPDIFVVFYCWQSDTHKNHGRYLIREALDLATDRLSRDIDLPFKVEIDSDTFNETGMCDIPATILKKLSKADAVVADLTFVAKTGNDKHCSNPNVLFELGYAFHAIGPERLICVMNEKHGPRREQIFDLAHRRHPISFTSPDESNTRSEAIEKLSASLEVAIRPIMKMGLSGSVGGDDERRHEAERARIESFWESQRDPQANHATIQLSFRPVRYRGRRWPDAAGLETVIRNRAVRSGQHEFPPQQLGTAAMEWGIYNRTYGDPTWALTYAGQVWFGTVVKGWNTLTVSDRELKTSLEPPTSNELEANRWIPIINLVGCFWNAFRFAASLVNEFLDGEVIEWSVEGRNLDGKWLATRAEWGEVLGPSLSPGLSKSGKSIAAEFKAHWLEHYVDCAKEACDLFSRDGRYVSREVLAKMVGG